MALAFILLKHFLNIQEPFKTVEKIKDLEACSIWDRRDIIKTAVHLRETGLVSTYSLVSWKYKYLSSLRRHAISLHNLFR